MPLRLVLQTRALQRNLKPTSLRWLQVATLLGSIFALSIFVRVPMLNKPLCRPREWLSANVLRTIQTWHETGIARNHFSLIMTYPGQADKNINNVNNYGSALSDSLGNSYYISYPPLAYYVPYVIFETLRIDPGVLPLQVLSLILHFITGLCVYLALKILVDSGNEFCVAAIVGFAIYIFSPQTLWLQANVYMCDIFVQVLFAAGIYFVLKWSKYGPVGIRSYLMLGLLLFGFVYAEWLGVFFGIFLLLFAFFNRAQAWAKGFALAVISGMASALTLTVLQYSSINGFANFVSSLFERYMLRSGLGYQPEMNFHPWNLLGWLLLVTYIILAYGADLVLVATWLAFDRGHTAPPLTKTMKAALLCTAVLPPLMHHLVLINFTADHEFSTLKDAPIISIVGGLLAWHVWRRAGLRWRALVLTSLAFFGVAAVWEYRIIVGPKITGYKEIGEYISKAAEPDEVLFLRSQDSNRRTNEPFPQTIWYAHRNIARWQNQAQARELVRRNGLSKAAVFVLDREESRVIEHIRIDFNHLNQQNSSGDTSNSLY